MSDITIELARGADQPGNTGCQAFHRRVGFTDMTDVPDYADLGRTRIVMRRPLPL